jgi:hypothetical protein
LPNTSGANKGFGGGISGDLNGAANGPHNQITNPSGVGMLPCSGSPQGRPCTPD